MASNTLISKAYGEGKSIAFQRAMDLASVKLGPSLSSILAYSVALGVPPNFPFPCL